MKAVAIIYAVFTFLYVQDKRSHLPLTLAAKSKFAWEHTRTDCYLQQRSHKDNETSHHYAMHG